MPEIATGKRKPGRPPKNGRMVLVADSVRSQQNAISALRAEQVLLRDAERFAFALSRKTILAELGRLDSPDAIVQAAREIFDNQWKTGKANALPRLFRKSKKTGPSVHDLQKAILRTINRYRERITRDFDGEAVCSSKSPVHHIQGNKPAAQSFRAAAWHLTG